MSPEALTLASWWAELGAQAAIADTLAALAPLLSAASCAALSLLPLVLTWIFLPKRARYQRITHQDYRVRPDHAALDGRVRLGTTISVQEASVSGGGDSWEIRGCGQKTRVPKVGTYKLVVDGRGPVLLVEVNGQLAAEDGARRAAVAVTPRCGAREHINDPGSDSCDKPRGHSGQHWCSDPMFSWGGR